MNILKLNSTRIKKLELMLSILFHEFNYIKVKKSGLVVMKKHWYSLKRNIFQATDLCVSDLPEKFAAQHMESQMYRTRYLSYITFLIRSDCKNIIDYLFEEFMKLNIIVPVSTKSNLPTNVYTNGIPIQKLSTHLKTYFEPFLLLK